MKRVIYIARMFIVVSAIWLMGVVPCLAADAGQDHLGKWSYTDEIRKFADPMTENLLQMINQDNYGQFSKDFSQKMKDVIPESEYKKIRDDIQTKFGSYASKEFVSLEIRETYLTVYYKVTFSQSEKPVLVRSVFVKENNKVRVGGFWLSPLSYTGNNGEQ
jgi:hypothetical protein